MRVSKLRRYYSAFSPPYARGKREKILEAGTPKEYFPVDFSNSFRYNRVTRKFFFGRQILC